MGYSAAHRRLRKAKPKTGGCEWCGAGGYTEYAYKGAALEYSTNPADYYELCASCHRGWDTKLRGEAHPRAKFSDADVKAIRASYTGAKGERAALARRYGVSKTHINRLVRGLRQ